MFLDIIMIYEFFIYSCVLVVYVGLCYIKCMCFENYELVCGLDDKIYSNECEVDCV